MEKLNKIAGYRAMLSLTQEELGEKIGISKQQYSLKERGRVSFSDNEKREIKNILIQYFPDITIDDIFFN